MSTEITSYKVLTYNTLIAYSQDGQNWCTKNLPALCHLSWDARRARLVTKMLETAPDVITLQEIVDRAGQATFVQFADLLRERGYAGLFGRRSDEEGCAIFYRADRFKHTTSRTIQLKDGRIAFMARLRSIAGDIFNVASLHLSHNPEIAAEQVVELQKSIERETREPTIITGDFNIRRDNGEYAYLTPLFNAGFSDPHPAVGPGTFKATPATTTGRPGSEIGQFRIDYTLISRAVTATDACVVGDPDNLQTIAEPSDHLPAQVTVSFPHEPRKSVKSMLEQIKSALRKPDTKEFMGFKSALTKFKRDIPKTVQDATYGYLSALGKKDEYFGQGEDAFLQKNGQDVGTTHRENAIDQAIANLGALL